MSRSSHASCSCSPLMPAAAAASTYCTSLSSPARPPVVARRYAIVSSYSAFASVAAASSSDFNLRAGPSAVTLSCAASAASSAAVSRLRSAASNAALRSRDARSLGESAASAACRAAAAAAASAAARRRSSACSFARSRCSASVRPIAPRKSKNVLAMSGVAFRSGGGGGAAVGFLRPKRSTSVAGGVAREAAANARCRSRSSRSSGAAQPHSAPVSFSVATAASSLVSFELSSAAMRSARWMADKRWRECRQR